MSFLIPSVAELEGLPADLMKELSVKTQKRLQPSYVSERNLLDTFVALGGCGSLNEIIIALHENYGIISDRYVVNQAVWRLVRKDKLTQLRLAFFSLKQSNKGA